MRFFQEIYAFFPMIVWRNFHFSPVLLWKVYIKKKSIKFAIFFCYQLKKFAICFCDFMIFILVSLTNLWQKQIEKIWDFCSDHLMNFTQRINEIFTNQLNKICFSPRTLMKFTIFQSPIIWRYSRTDFGIFCRVKKSRLSSKIKKKLLKNHMSVKELKGENAQNIFYYAGFSCFGQD